MPTRRLFLGLILAMLLLSAQQAAVTHALWHAHGSAPEQHENGESKGSFHAGSCKWHGAFCQVLGGVASGSTSLVEQYGPAEQAAAPALPCIALLSPAPLSRGPPVLL
jgi:hypothetical protein